MRTRGAMNKKDPEITALEAEIRRHNALYWDEQKPEIDDYAYDALVNRLKALAPDSPVLMELGPSRHFGEERKHKEPMLSLDKCYTDEELADWAGDVAGKIVAMPKLDGIAGAIHYGDDGKLAVAATRGDGFTGDDITQNVLEISDIPRQIDGGPLEVRGEIYMRLSVFERYKQEGMANPRNLTAGAIKQKDRRKSAAYALSFFAYDLLGSDSETLAEALERLHELGFAKMPHRLLEKDALRDAFADYSKLRPSLDYEIDGVVFKANELKEQRRLGLTSHHPRYAIAYKFQGDTGLSTLREVEWSVARTGAITPVAIVDPVALSGVTVTRASLHNVAYIDKLGLTLNCKLTIVRRGGVIPNVEHVTEAGDAPVVIPERCPSCGKATVRERDFLFCSKPSECKWAILGQLVHFASVIDLRGFGEAVLEQLYDRGLVRDAADLYTLKEAYIEALDRSGEKLAKKLIAELDKKRTLDLATFLRALGLPDLGKHVSQILADRYRALDAVLAVDEAELAATHGIGEIIAKNVVDGLAAAKPLIARLKKHVTFAADSGPVEGPLSGKSFVFTGKMVAFARSEGEKRVRQRGGAVLSSVTKALTYLVVGANKEGGPSTKQKAADKLISQGAPIRVLSEAELLAMLED
ncbi:MAG: NAD-dependent DNA ligase LigA [Deltaproteobacteria bacterium]|nr:NAD-dependent DNA ligase LigA [Deltaproteobacteria bacterium]